MLAYQNNFCYSIFACSFSLLAYFTMKLNCIECKNDVDLSSYPNLAKDQVIECNHCGISLLVVDVVNGVGTAEVVDEGK